MAVASGRKPSLAKMPLLSGNPSRQSQRQGDMQAMSPKGMPLMSPGKPRKSIVGKPSSVPMNKNTKQPKGSGAQRVSKSTVKGAPRKSAGMLNGRQSRGGRINPADMGI